MHASWKSVVGVKAFRTRGGVPYFVVYCIFINKFFENLPGEALCYTTFLPHPTVCIYDHKLFKHSKQKIKMILWDRLTGFYFVHLSYWTSNSNSNFWNHLALYFRWYYNFFRFLFSFQLRRPKFWRKLIRKGCLLIVKVPKNFFWGK